MYVIIVSTIIIIIIIIISSSSSSSSSSIIVIIIMLNIIVARPAEPVAEDTANFMVFDRGTFRVLPLICFVSSQKCQGVPFSPICQN